MTRSAPCTRAPSQPHQQFLIFVVIDSQCAVRSDFGVLVALVSTSTPVVSAVSGLHVLCHTLSRADTHVLPTGRVWPIVVHTLRVCRERQRPVGPDLVTTCRFV